MPKRQRTKANHWTPEQKIAYARGERHACPLCEEECATTEMEGNHKVPLRHSEKYGLSYKRPPNWLLCSACHVLKTTCEKGDRSPTMRSVETYKPTRSPRVGFGELKVLTRKLKEKRLDSALWNRLTEHVAAGDWLPMGGNRGGYKEVADLAALLSRPPGLHHPLQQPQRMPVANKQALRSRLQKGDAERPLKVHTLRLPTTGHTEVALKRPATLLQQLWRAGLHGAHHRFVHATTPGAFHGKRTFAVVTDKHAKPTKVVRLLVRGESSYGEGNASIDFDPARGKVVQANVDVATGKVAVAYKPIAMLHLAESLSRAKLRGRYHRFVQASTPGAFAGKRTFLVVTDARGKPTRAVRLLVDGQTALTFDFDRSWGDVRRVEVDLDRGEIDVYYEPHGGATRQVVSGA